MIGQEKAGSLARARALLISALFGLVLLSFAWILDLAAILKLPPYLNLGLAAFSAATFLGFVNSAPLCSRCKRTLWTIFKRSPICCFAEKVHLKRTFTRSLSYIAGFYLAGGLCAIYFTPITTQYEKLVTYVREKTRRPRYEQYVARVRAQQAVLAKSENDVGANVELGYIYYNARQHDAAIKQFKKVQKLDPNNSEARLLLGITYGDQKFHRREEEEYKNLLKDNPYDVEAQINLGINYIRQQIYDKAIEEFNKTVKACEKVLKKLETQAKARGVSSKDFASQYAAERYRVGICHYNLAIVYGLRNDYRFKNSSASAAKKYGVDISELGNHITEYRAGR